MHLGTIRIKDNIIYIDIKNKELYCYKQTKNKKIIISNEIIINLIKYIITCHKPKYLYQDEFEVYLDEETNFKHFYKNGKEDYLKFFYENGQSAILLNSKSNGDKYSTKSFIIKGVQICITFLSAITFISSVSAIYKIQTTTKINAQTEITNNIEYSIPEEKIDTNFFKDFINSSPNLSKQEKQLLINNDLFDDLSETLMTNDRIFSLEVKMTNLDIIYGQEGKPADGVLGWYNPVLSNQLHVVNENDSQTTIHEFIHLMQDDNQYHYIREACATLIGNEYYKTDQIAYNDAIIRTQFLMDIIGPDIIWNLNFSGSTREFENAIKNLLPEKDAEELLELFTSSIGMISQSENYEINKKIDKYLMQMYKYSDPESKETLEFLTDISNSNYLSSKGYLLNRNYFNKENKENAINPFEYNFSVPLDTALSQNMIDISYTVTQKNYINPSDTSQISSDDIIHKEYIPLNENISELIIDEDGNEYFLDFSTGKKYSISEAQTLGLVDTKYYQYKFFHNISYEEITKYKDIPKIIINTPEIKFLAPYNDIENISAYTNETYPLNNITITFVPKQYLYQNENSKTK